MALRSVGAMFSGIDTARLHLRAYTAGDVDSFTALRDDPDVARLQNWQLPWRREQSERFIASLSDQPTADGWWHVAVCAREGGQHIGDVCFGFTFGLRSAEIGFSFRPEFQGQGYAFEAADALVAWLFDTVAPTRIWGMLHPDNHPSAVLLERLGMRFEGHTKSSFWLGDDNSDDLIYGMTRADWESWRTRPRDAPANVEVVPVAPDNAAALRRLVTHKSQERFVAPMLYSFAEAMYPEPEAEYDVVPVLRAVLADGEPVGFIMYSDVARGQDDPYLWRFLVDRRHQQRGIGRRALRIFHDQLRADGMNAVYVSWVPGRGGPERLYLSEGYELTGEVDDDEVVARKAL